MRYMGSFLEDAWDATGGQIVDVATSVYDDVPGLKDLVNGPLRDFANTTVGKVVLRAISTTFYGSTVPFLGPQLASVAFAVPGLFRGQDFEHAWFDEVKFRAEQTAEILGGEAAQIFGQQLADTLVKLGNDVGVGNMISDSIQALAVRYGIREDVSAFAKSIWNGLDAPDLSLFDPASGRGLLIARQSNTFAPSKYAPDLALKQSLQFAQLARNVAPDTDLLNAIRSGNVSTPAPPAGAYSMPSQSPNRSSGDVLLGVSLASAAAALAWYFWPSKRRRA